MRFDIVTLFPELFPPHAQHGVTRRAFESGRVDVHLWPLRDFADGAYRRVDDRPFGGGPGMVILAEPLERALVAIRAARAEGVPAPLVHFTPTGRRIDQSTVREFATGAGAVLLCGRYEGVDQRFVDRHVDIELSLGDFVLSGGELPALALLDAVARLQEGVLGDSQSHEQDSFSQGLLDCPHYSRPERLAGPPHESVPPVLLSGHHADIARWRRERSLEVTARRRPDLIEAARVGRAAEPRRRALSGLARAIIAGFSILCRSGPSRRRGPTNDSQPAGTITGETMDLIQTLEAEEIARLNKTIPPFAPGDTVIVSVKVVEGTRKRLQAYEGVVIAKRNRGLNSSFIVRKISSGEGVERTFQVYSPLIASIEVKRRGDVRRAKLYYLRERSGKSARIKEKLA